MSEIRFLLDENVVPAFRTALLQQAPTMLVWKVGEPGVPPKGTKDPDILDWCEENRFILVTNNRKSICLLATQILLRCPLPYIVGELQALYAFQSSKIFHSYVTPSSLRSEAMADNIEVLDTRHQHSPGGTVASWQSRLT